MAESAEDMAVRVIRAVLRSDARHLSATQVANVVIDALTAAGLAIVPTAILRRAEDALEDLHACDDPRCREPNCNHALTDIRAALKSVENANSAPDACIR